MPDIPKMPPIGDPPPPKKSVKADTRMRDPFTDLPLHLAGGGQRANKPQPDRDDQSENIEETVAVEEGFSPIP
jgi:hypothetical protein